MLKKCTSRNNNSTLVKTVIREQAYKKYTGDLITFKIIKKYRMETTEIGSINIFMISFYM